MADMMLDIWESVANHIELNVSTPEAVTGNDIDIGEEFDVYFEVRNTFPPGIAGMHPHFMNAKLILDGTKYAQPSDGAHVELPIGDSPQHHPSIKDHLGFNQVNGITVRFTALAKIDEWVDPISGPVNMPEHFVTARVEADFDLSRFFRVVRKANFFTQIDDG